VQQNHRRSQVGSKGPCPPKFLEKIVILCFERRFSKQNSVIRLKSNIFGLPKFLGCPPKVVTPLSKMLPRRVADLATVKS